MSAPARYSIFDMDRTVTRGGSYSPWLLYWAWHEAPWRLILLPLSLLAGAAYLLKLVSRGRLKEINHRLLMGKVTNTAKAGRRADAFADDVLMPRAFNDAVDRIRTEQAEGREVVLATASYAFYVRPFADRLGVGMIVATRSQRSGDGSILARLDGPNCYGEAKREMVASALPPREELHVRFFSDHHSDAPMFEWADEGFAVNPTPKLLALAEKRGWQVLNWR